MSAGPRVVPARGDPPPAAALDAAAAALRDGGVVALPTDTVYGVAVLAALPGAAASVFALKRRDPDVALPVLVHDLDQARALAVLDEAAATLAERFWPGGLTIVAPRRPGVELDLGGDPSTVGVRCPDHPVPRALAGRVGPLAATSANLHGEDTPATAAGVGSALGTGLALVLDGGPCGGTASTVVDCTRAEVACLREGAVPFAEVRRALGS